MTALRGPGDAVRPLHLVTILTADSQVSGGTRLVSGRQRLVDLLNAPEPTVELEAVKIVMPGFEPRLLDSFSVLKESVLLAIPHETQAQVRDLSVQRSLLGRVSRRTAPMLILLPSMTVEGTAYLPAGAGPLQFSPTLFASFFAITEACISRPNLEVLNAPVVVINRQQVVGVFFDPRREHLT